MTTNAIPDRHQELVDVAAALFRKRGYDATSMQEIADRMGILKGSLYHYVRTKEDLLWMVMEPPLRDLVENAREILEDRDTSFGERITAVMEAHAVSFEKNHPYMFVLTRENGDTLSIERRKALQDLRRQYFALLRDTIEAGQKEGELREDVEPAVAVHGIFGMLNWMFRWFNPRGRLKARVVAHQFAVIAISGLVKQD